MSDNTSIILIHQGYDWYLYYTLNQIKSLTANTPLYLLGDDKVIKAFSQANSINLNTLYSTRVAEFVDSYVHMSTNPYDFELFCFLRWFYLLEFMKSEKITKVFYLDSDILLYTPLEKIFAIYEGRLLNCGYMIPQQEYHSFSWAGTGGTSYWHYEALDEFCRFLTATYRDREILPLYQQKWDYHKSKKIVGGVCDMTAFYFFWMRESKHITNFSKIVQGNAFDANINSSMNYYRKEFKMRGSFKKINFKNNKPFGETIDQNREIRFHSLHFQGAAKWSMPMYYTGEPFKRKFSHDISLYRLKTKEVLKKIKYLTTGKGQMG